MEPNIKEIVVSSGELEVYEIFRDRSCINCGKLI